MELEDPILQVQVLVLALLLVASIVTIAVRRFRIPYTVALVLAGVALTLNTGIRIELSSKLILSLFVPPLVFEAAFHLNFELLRRNIGTIVLFAVPGVILTMLLVGGVVMQMCFTPAILAGMHPIRTDETKGVSPPRPPGTYTPAASTGRTSCPNTVPSTLVVNQDCST